MQSTIQINKSQRGTWCVIDLSGRIDATSAAYTEIFLSDVLSERSKIALNLSNLKYISSAGLRTLLIIAKTAKKHDKKVVICSPKGQVKEVFEDFDIEAFYRVYDSIDELASVI